MEIRRLTEIFVWLVIFSLFHDVHYVNGGDSCTRLENGHYVEEYCDYGCCGSGNNQTCCSISTSVLLVACIVGGLVLVALVTAMVVCCYKSYKDKQASRVRTLQQQQNMNAPRVPGVEPPKPPSYISAPPAYSEEMPESHFRPPTVTGNVPYNQRFRGITPTPRLNAQGSISMTMTSGRNPTMRSLRNVQIPGTVETEAPPPYTEFIRGQTPANRHRRFIRTPVEETTEQVNQHNSVTHTVHEINDVLSVISDETESRDESSIQPSRAATSRVIDSRATESRAVTTRADESRLENIRENESRAETVARILRPSRISRIPTLVHGIQSRQLSDVQSRGSSISTRQTFYEENSPNSNTAGVRNQNVVRQNIGLSNI